MDDRDCDAVIAAPAAAVAHVQNLSQEVGFADERLGLFDFDLSSAETEFWWLEEEAKEKKPKLQRRAYTRPEYMASTWGQWLLKLEDLSAANDGLDHACREVTLLAEYCYYRLTRRVSLYGLIVLPPKKVRYIWK